MITIAQYPGGISEIRKLLEHMQGPESLLRGKRAAFERRAKIDAGQHIAMIRARICEVYATPEAQEQICKHADTSRNVLRYTTDAIAVPYNTAATRTIRGASESQAKAFRKVYRDAEIDAMLEAAGRVAVHSNVAHVLVRWEASGPRVMLLSPHQCDVLWHPDGNEADPSILTYETTSMGAARVLVDSERWVWLDKDWRIIAEEGHDLGMVPWVRWRWRTQVADYWDVELGRELVDATLDVGRIAAHMRWVRTHRAQKAVFQRLGINDPMPPAQSLNSSGAVLLQGSAQAELGIVDHEVAPNNFLTDIREAHGAAIAAYGLHSANDAGRVDEDAERDRLGKMRARQLGHFARAELELARRVAAMLRVHGGPEEKIDDELVREGFRVRFAPFVAADSPTEQVATAKEQQRMGATDPVAFYLQLHPELTEEAAREEVYAHVAEIADFTSLLVTRGLAIGDGNQLQTLSQAQGRIGGQASGAARSGPDPEDDPSEDDQP